MLVAESVVGSAVETARMLCLVPTVSLLAAGSVVEWAAVLVADWVAGSAAVLVADSAVALAVELGCMSRQTQVVSVLVAETAAGLVAV